MQTPNGAERETGLPAVGRVPWGSHFCIFYETKQDLLDILVPYFKTGLEANECCLWIVTPYEFLSEADAIAALRQKLPNIDDYLRGRQLTVRRHSDWFAGNGIFDTSKAVARFRRKSAEAERRGLSGLRVNGSSAWISFQLGPAKFCKFERDLDAWLANGRIIVACTFPLHLIGAGEILDAARTHQFAVTVRNGVWKRVEIADVKDARAAKRNASRSLHKLSPRQRETLQRIAEGQNTKEIAGLLGISAKTVEAHRLQLMRRLKIHDVPGLVRLAIRTGLVSAET
ncbi:MAG TPA: MEDS domain-containing protein [Chthoniobacterales bacterium]|nr:MEDS domain-containing protein [Chthoniobacterales bacterium]